MEGHTFFLWCIGVVVLLFVIYILVKKRDRRWDFGVAFVATLLGVYAAFYFNGVAERESMNNVTIARASAMYLHSIYNFQMADEMYNAYSNTASRKINVSRLDDTTAMTLFQDPNVLYILSIQQLTLIGNYLSVIKSVNAKNQIYLNDMTAVRYQVTEEGKIIRKSLAKSLCKFLKICSRVRKEFKNFTPESAGDENGNYKSQTP